MYRYIWKITLNNPKEVSELVSHWRAGSTLLQTYPGAMGTHFHEASGEPGCFFAVAEWESAQARENAMQDVEENTSETAKAWNLLPKNESFGEVVSFAGSELGVVFPKQS